MHRRFFPLALLILLIVPLQADAQSVMRSEVDIVIEDEDAVTARQQAMSQAETLAFRQLLSQRMGDQAASLLNEITPQQIAAMVRGAELVKERITPGRYEATIAVKYDASMLQNMLGPAPPAPDAYLPPREDGPALLVLGVQKSPRGIELWEASNAWRQALSRAVLERGRDRLVVPYGDPQDMVTLDATNVMFADYRILQPLLARYGTDQGVVAIAVFDALAPQEIALELKNVTVDGVTAQPLSVQREPEEELPAFLNRAAALAADTLMDAAEPPAPDFARPPEGPARELNAVTTILRLSDWTRMRSALLAIPGVLEVMPTAIGHTRVAYTLRFQGTPETLGARLGQAGIRVEQRENHLLLGLQ